MITIMEARQRLAELEERLAEATVKSGRPAGQVALLGVSKTFPAEAAAAFLAAGLRDFGESYVQEARDKVARVAAGLPAGLSGPRWHFIGHLQTNKARQVAPFFEVLHSLDSLDLAAELDRRLSALDRRLSVYVQVNVAGEAGKSGLTPAALPAFLEKLAAWPRLEPAGLMTMPPYDPDPEASRPHFAALRRLRDRYLPGLGLSMGMSGDFEVAVAEGATVVRIGASLFGQRGLF